MQKADIRAVENPISAIFDLAEDVQGRVPKVKKLVTYSRAFIYLWLFINFLVIVAISNWPFLALILLSGTTILLYTIRWADTSESRAVLLALAAVFLVAIFIFSLGPQVLFAALFIIFFYLGWIILDLLRDMRKFFDYYVVRHKVINAVRNANPVVPIPEGADPVSRLLSYLHMTGGETSQVMSMPNAVSRGVPLMGRSGVVHNFEAMILAQSSSLRTFIPWAHPGWCILVKLYSSPPNLEDLKYLKHAAEDISMAMRVPPRRVIALCGMKADETLSEDAYQFLTSQVVTFRQYGDTLMCSMETIAETEDGTYDLVPFVAEIPS